jgi:type I restriction enzyme S subunit
MSSRPPQTLNDACEFIVDCLHATAPTQLEGYPLIRTPNIGRGRLDLADVYRVSEDTYETWTKRAVPESGDLILAREAPAGNVAVVKEGQQVCLGQRTVHLRPNKAKVDPDFLCYFLLAPPQQGKLLAGETGATAKHVNMKDIRKLQLSGLPSRPAQQATGSLLSAYDDLIENNRRRMMLLGEAARQVYRDWFVRLRFPGHEHTRITNGVPEAWYPKVLAEVCESLEDGDWIEIKDQGGEDFRLLQISNIGVNEFVETGNFRFITEQTFRQLNCREILPGHILVSRMPKPIGRAWLVTGMPWRMITAVDVAIVVLDDDFADPYFLTQFLNSPASLEHCERRAVGATRPRVARRELATLPLLLPPRRLQEHFRQVAEDLNEQRANLYRQNEKLRAARDLLLPRLMSGEIAV